MCVSMYEPIWAFVQRFKNLTVTLRIWLSDG